jgi:CubicO group peptidase (beta-lactamase class C family)
MNRKTVLLAMCVLFCWAGSVFPQSTTKSKRPEEVGFASDRLARITQFFQSEIDKGSIPGAVLLVSREGKVAYLQTVGQQDREKSIPMKPDAIFRIASMTKPIASVAITMLAEEGKIDLIAPVSQYLPEFKDVKVGVEKIDAVSGKPASSLEDPKRRVTVQDLLRHTSGLVYGRLETPSSTRPIKRQICSTTIRRWRSSSPNYRSCRSLASPAQFLSTACRSTC